MTPNSHRSIDKQAEKKAAQKVTWIGLWVNAANALVKILVGFWAQSQALVADGLHSLSDLLSDALVLVATHFGRQAPDQDHPYGHDRYETLATLLLGALLIGVAGALAWDSLSRLWSSSSFALPHWIALVVALASIASKEWIFRYTLRIATALRSKLLTANAWHHRSDALSSVVVLVALLGSFAGFSWLDQLAAIILSAMIARMGIQLIWSSLQELVDTALPEATTRAIKEAAQSIPGVRGVHHLRTRSMGNRTLLDIHLQVPPHISVSEGHEIGVWVARHLRDTFVDIDDITYHIDPEDDAAVLAPHPEALLPLRPEVMQLLQARWQGLAAYQPPQKITLHYLNHQIEIDLYYTQDQLTQHQDDLLVHAQALQQALVSAVEDLPWIRRVKLWVQPRSD
ncbi:cation diffusion facilitator family transporter [Marinospirillum sp.]|uniref:cation diffusion facilitator family transporter n=1 Tax=Marinospirillum sp. TaxID=2183934 RepID=UPI003A8907D5